MEKTLKTSYSNSEFAGDLSDSKENVWIEVVPNEWVLTSLFSGDGVLLSSRETDTVKLIVRSPESSNIALGGNSECWRREVQGHAALLM